MEVGLLPLPLVREVEAGDGRRRWDQVNAIKSGRADETAGVGFRGRVEERLGAGIAVRGVQEGAGEIALRVEVHGQQAVAPLLAHRRQQPAGVSLAHPAFKVEDGNDTGSAGRHAPAAYHRGHDSGKSVTSESAWCRSSMGIDSTQKPHAVLHVEDPAGLLWEAFRVLAP